MQRSVLGAALASLLMIGALSGCATQTKALVSGNAAASASGNGSSTTKASTSTSSQTASQTNTTAASTGGGSGSSSGSAGSSTQASAQSQISVTAKGASPNISSTQKTKAQATVNQMVKIVNKLH